MTKGYKIECYCSHKFIWYKENPSPCRICGSNYGIYKGVNVCLKNIKKKEERK